MYAPEEQSHLLGILKGFLVCDGPQMVSTGALSTVPGQKCAGSMLTRDGLVVCRTVFGPMFWPYIVESQGLRIKTGKQKEIWGLQRSGVSRANPECSGYLCLPSILGHLRSLTTSEDTLAGWMIKKMVLEALQRKPGADPVLLQAQREPGLGYRSFRDNGARNSDGQPTHLG